MTRIPIENLKGMMESQAFLMQRPSEYFASVVEYRKKMNQKYESLIRFSEKYKEICEEIYQEFEKVAKREKLKVGNLKIVWVGGRLQGKPLDDSSDIDLVFYVDNSAYDLSIFGTDIYKKVREIFGKYDIKIDLDDFHFDTIWYNRGLQRKKQPYCLLLDKKVN